MYRIEFDDKAGLMRLKMTGFWNGETMAAFVAELTATTEQVRKTRASFNVLSDATEFPVQSVEISEALGQVMRTGVEMNVLRAAVVVANTLAKLQGQRQYSHPSIALFLNLDDALAWLGKAPTA